MDFYEINEWFWSLHPIVHLATFAVMTALYTHLTFGFYIVRKKLPKHVIKYFFIRSLIVVALLFMKIDAMLDLFLPLYIISYVDGLIILNGFGLYRCKNMKQAAKKISTFQSRK